LFLASRDKGGEALASLLIIGTYVVGEVQTALSGRF